MKNYVIDGVAVNEVTNAFVLPFVLQVFCPKCLAPCGCLSCTSPTQCGKTTGGSKFSLSFSLSLGTAFLTRPCADGGHYTSPLCRTTSCATAA